ncbi:MAG: glycosyltransferase family 2 protein [Nitrosomonadales bacterium]|nr:glycosyltransferase family 2 protein [Nitrosomonadales bacterium]
MIEVPTPKISIALCVHNGERYVDEQLQSLLSQTCLPYELVVCDDASEDATPVIVEAFAAEAPFKVHLYRNSQRLGIGANFEQAIRLCTGNIIALCDQDDVWLPNKLATFAELIKTGVDWVCCDAEVCDAELHPLGYTLWQRVDFDHSERKTARDGRFIEVLIKHYVVAGATLAFKAQARDQLLPIPREWHYDAWLAAVLAATEKGALVELPLQLYRQHGGNALGAARRGLLNEARSAFSMDRATYYQAEIARWSRLAAHLENKVRAHIETRLAAKLAHLRRRAALPPNRFARLPAVIAETVRGGYSRYARNWGSIALDLLVR